MPVRKFSRLPNKYGSVSKLSGNRRKPYFVRVNLHTENGKKKYDILGYYSDKASALQALAEYNKNPFDINKSKATFKDIYELWYDKKYNKSKKILSESSKRTTKGSFNKCKPLHNMIFADIRSSDLQNILDDFSISHAYLEMIKSLFNQMYAYALEYDIIQKDYSAFLKINKEDDDESGVPFTEEEVERIWQNKDKPFVDVILIYVYSGFRMSELLDMPLENIDLEQKIFFGGKKTPAGRDRIVPIHSKIFDFVKNRYVVGHKTLFYNGDRRIRKDTFYKMFKQALLYCDITEEHTTHDCRHTFGSMLDKAECNEMCVKLMMGHKLDNVTQKYIHKSVEDLRTEIEKI